jgi:hypothetical protein
MSKTVEVPARLVEICRSMAERIKLSHGGWWESYCSQDQRDLVKIVEELDND